MSEKEKWYNSTGIIVLLLIFFWPVGLILTWINPKWSTKVKGIITAVIGSMAVIGILMVFAAVTVFVGTVDKAINETSTTTTPQPTTQQSEKTKVYKLGQAQQGDYWQYIPKKVKRTYIIGSEFSKKSAGKGQEFLMVYITVKNVTNETQSTNFMFDPQPVVLSGNQTYEYDWKDYIEGGFAEAEDVAPGGTESGWLLFKIPAGKKGLKLQIEDFVWDLGL